ncbi:MAG: hypothetical protein PHG02_05885 [Oscillospiraceae bacterium]|nr:hypothetical protein [Oscillospiraceae bacterium]
MKTLIYKLITSNSVVLALLLLAFITDATGWIKLSVAAAFIHETGHVVAYWLVLKKRPTIRLAIGGIQMQAASLLPRRAERIILLAGPFANVLFFAAVYIYMQYLPATYNGYFFCAANLCMALFNLLPISFLDGGRLLESSLPARYQAIVYTVDKAALGIGVSAFIITAFCANSTVQRLGILLAAVYLLIKSLQ